MTIEEIQARKAEITVELDSADITEELNSPKQMKERKIKQ